jgi:hypothetical protein
VSARLDGFAILRAVAGDSELFCDVRAAVDKAALATMTARFRARTFDLDRLRRTRKALGADLLARILEHVPDAVLRSLIGRIDPHHPMSATGGAGWARSHVMALASGAATPRQEQAVPTKTPITRKASSAKSRSKRKEKPRPEGDLAAEGFWAASVMAKPRRLPRAGRKPK